jgi:hypothetical protein
MDIQECANNVPGIFTCHVALFSPFLALINELIKVKMCHKLDKIVMETKIR